MFAQFAQKNLKFLAKIVNGKIFFDAFRQEGEYRKRSAALNRLIAARQ